MCIIERYISSGEGHSPIDEFLRPGKLRLNRLSIRVHRQDNPVAPRSRGAPQGQNPDREKGNGENR